MAHYALIDNNGIVVQVITGKDEGDEGVNWEQKYGEISGYDCKQTSYNTVAGVHKLGETPFRKNYAGIGFTYDRIRDAFIPPKPFASWTLNETTCCWDPPVPIPEDDNTGEPPKIYAWDEITLSWVDVTPTE